jgi:methylase of polypeptide subunit release factors
MDPSIPAPGSIPPGILAEFRATLEGHGFTKDGLLAFLQHYQSSDKGPNLSMIRLLVREPTPLNTLCRLFLLADAVPREEVSTVFPKPIRESLTAAGLLLPHEGNIRAVGQLTPLQSLTILSDFSPETTGLPFAPDYVLGIGSASLNLAGLTVRREGGTVLDVGTGGGIQTLLAASFARQVVGTDTNARALGFASFNAALNGVENVTFRQGSLYEPVQGETFDLIVSNPPFVISPNTSEEFRTATDRPGDAITEAVVRGAGERLNQDGFAVLLLNWHHQNDDDWAERPLSWAEGDAWGRWLLCFDTDSPFAYASRFLNDGTLRLDSRELASEMDRWLAYYREHGVGRVSAGALVLFKTHTPWVRSERIARHVYRQGFCGDQIERICRAESLLADISDPRALLDRRFRLAPHHRLTHELALTKGRWTVLSETLSFARGLDLAGAVDPNVTALLERLDGERPLRAAIKDVARLLGVEPTDLEEPVLAVMGRLLRTGLLEMPFG